MTWAFTVAQRLGTRRVSLHASVDSLISNILKVIILLCKETIDAGLVLSNLIFIDFDTEELNQLA